MNPPNKLKDFLKKEGITVEAFRKKLSPSPSRATISYWLSGTKAPAKGSWISQIEEITGIPQREWFVFKIQNKKRRIDNKLKNMTSL